MKKIIFLLAFLPGLFHAQDLSWGVSTNLGLSKATMYYTSLDSTNLIRDNGLNLSTYLSYRVVGPLYLKGELFAQSNVTKSILNMNRNEIYSFGGFLNDDYCDIYYRSRVIQKSYGLSAIIGCELGDFDFYGGLAFNLINTSKVKVNGDGVEHYSEGNPINSDQEILDNYIDEAYAQAEWEMFWLGSNIYDRTTLVYGLQYHVNNLNFGYRRSYGFHQLTLGYDIGRYRYE
jgi:hypothetical protein